MAYTKNHDPWVAGDLITISDLNNFETIYTESSAYLASHVHDGLYYTQTQMLSTYWNASNDGDGSGADADLIYKSTGNLHASSFAGYGVPSGLIIMWAGESVPFGWLLCDGTNGTQDLTDRFVLGAGSTYAVGATGTGSHAPDGTITIAGHSLSFLEIAGHQHAYEDYYSDNGPIETYSSGTGQLGVTITSANRTTGNSSVGKAIADPHSHTATFTGDSVEFLPPYYSLAFIQKI